MRLGLLFLMAFSLAAVYAQDEETDKLGRRFGIEVDPLKYPQKSPEAALQSVARALDERRIDYLMAQLADPVFVDKKITEYKARLQGKEESRRVLAFNRIVTETSRYYLDEPSLVRELKRFAREAEWKTEAAAAVATVKGLSGRQIFMRKVQDRWFLENKQK